jgi:DNA transposition AAA+ family ATPase
MDNKEKKQISAALATYCQQIGSQNKAANSLRGVSSATISQTLNGNWEAITDEMWRNIAAQTDYDPTAWVTVETQPFARFWQVLTDAQENSVVFGVVGDAGCGKSATAKAYAAQNANVIRLSCSEFWNRKTFLCELLRAAGMDFSGYTIAEMMNDVITELKRKETPLIILDEADKLSDQVLYFFITLYNALEDRCGLVLCATDFLEKRVKRGVNLNKKGYKEINSRLGRKFIPLQVINADDVAAI